MRRVSDAGSLDSLHVEILLAKFCFAEHNSRMKDFSPSRLPAHLIFLVRALVNRKEWTPETVEAGLGWEAGRYRKIVEGPEQARLGECFKLLEFAIEVEPAEQPGVRPQSQAAQDTATSLPAAFYARSPYRNHSTPLEGDRVLQYGDDATPSFLHVTAVMLRVAEALKAEGCLDDEPVKESLREYLHHLTGPGGSDDSMAN